MTRNTLLIIILLLFPGLQSQAQNKSKVELFLVKKAVADTGISFYLPSTSRDIQGNPFISDPEILSYDTSRFEIVFSKVASARIANLDPPLPNGIPFALTVDRIPILSGYFFNIYSSFGCISYVLMNVASEKQFLRKGLPEVKGTSIPELRKATVLVNAFKSSGRLIQSGQSK